jgi:zinc protease
MISPSRFSARCPFSWLAAWVLCLALLSPGSATAVSEPPWPHEQSTLAPDPDAVFGRLDNGFRYVIMPNDRPEGRVSMHLNIQAGSFHETDDQQGAAHFLEHMLFNGSEHFAPGELVKYFQRIGMRFGPDANAHTGFFETVYDVLLPESDRQSLEDGLLVLWDYAAGALLLEAEIESERKVILAEKRTRDSVSYRTFVETFDFELDGTRLTRRLPIGEEPDLHQMGRPDLKDYYDTWYRPERMILVMVGDVDVDLARSLIEARFRDIAARASSRPEPAPGEIDHQGVKVFHHYEAEAGNTEVTLETIRRSPSLPDSAFWRRERLLRDMADRIIQDRLDARLNQPDPPFTDATISSGRYLNLVDYAAIHAETRPSDWRTAMSEIETALRRALTHGFTEAEVERVKKDFRSDLERAVEGAPTRESNDLAREIISTLNRNRVFRSPSQDLGLLSPAIDAATPTALHEALRRSWDPSHRLVLVTGNAEIGPTPEANIRSAYEKSRSVAVSPPEKTQPVVFPYLDPPDTGGEIRQQTRIEDLDITQVDFANGLRLNLKPTDFKAQEVRVRLIFGEGRSGEPADRPGLGPVSEAVVTESGLGRLNRDDLDRALAGKKTQVRFGINDETFYLSGRTVPAELELLFALLHAHLTDPGFRRPAFDLVMSRFRQKYKALSRSVDGVLYLKGRRFLAGGDSRFGLPPLSDLTGLTLADVRDWVRPALDKAPLELSVVGDFDPETAIELAGRYLGSLSRRPGGEDEPRPGRPAVPSGESMTAEVDTRIPKGLVVVAYPTDDQWDIHQTRRLSVLGSLFSDRLRETVREKLGAAYSPVAYNAPSRAYPGYGVFQAAVHVDPSARETVIGEIQTIASDLAADPVPADELQRAVDPTLTGIRDMRQDNGYWLKTVLSGSAEHPEQIEWSRTILSDYAAITPAEVHSVARQYLKPEAAATVVITPVSSDED